MKRTERSAPPTVAFLKIAATHERNLLGVYADLYPAAVEKVATALRARLESGELRGWCDGDSDRYKGRALPPRFHLENECRRRWITGPVRALAVLTHSPNADRGDDGWSWDILGRGPTLAGAAMTAMAGDVLAYARALGWTRRRPTEEAVLPMRRAA